MIQIFSLPLDANEAREVAVTGEYFELRNAVHPVAMIELLDRSGGVVSRLENPEQSDFVKPGRYETIRITNGPIAQTVRHFYGSGDAGSRRTSGLVQVDGTVNVMGDVSVIDGGKNRVKTGKSFIAGDYSNAVPGEYSEVQIWNPAGSGINLVVNQVGFSSAINSSIFLYKRTAALASARDSGNKMFGQPTGVGQLRKGSTAAFTNDYFCYSLVQAYAQGGIKFSDPLIVTPGTGLSVNGAILDNLIGATFEYFEEPV